MISDRKNAPLLNWEDLRSYFLTIGSGNFNLSHLTLDYQAKLHPEKTAYICIDSDLKNKTYSYHYLKTHSNQFAHLLSSLNIKKGDRVFIYMPRIIESVIALTGIVKTGAVAGTLFSAFEEKALLDRLLDSQAKIVVTTATLLGRIKKIKHLLTHLEKIIVVGEISEIEDGIVSFSELKKFPDEFEIPTSKLDDDAFMLYTSGSTGKPKGVVHSHKVLLQQFSSLKQVFNPNEKDIYWCSADLGWITGVSYVVFGPLSHGLTSILFEGRFDPQSWFDILKKNDVSVFYTAPTAIRMLMASNIKKETLDLKKLRIVASVGEPLNPEAIKWGIKVLNKTILDTWFQTELGSICISNTYDKEVKLGSMGLPLDGVVADIVDDDGTKVGSGTIGNLVLGTNIPSLMKSVWHNQEKYDSYFSHGRYYTGDLAYKDDDGYIFFTGRGDDIINTQGERVGPFEIESALIAHPLVIEAGVIGKPDQLRGEVIKAFVVLSGKVADEDVLVKELIDFVKEQMGGPFYPREIEFTTSLPKTRSGKIMRRVLKAKELHLDPGDLSSIEKE